LADGLNHFSDEMMFDTDKIMDEGIVMRPQQWIQLTFVHCIKQKVLYVLYILYSPHFKNS
jgi:hypothetical protein